MFSEKVSFISLNRKKKLCLCFPAVWFLLFKKSYLKKEEEKKEKRHKGLCAKNRADQFKREPREFIADFHGDGNY